MLQDKVAYITGGTKGIGLGIAKILSQNGIRVAISGRKSEDVENAAAEISSDSSKVLGIVSNVRNFNDEENAVSAIKNHFGQLDFVIANDNVF